MKTIFDLCEPRDDILSGELRADMFAARLRDVIENRAEPIYNDSNVFFENTYPTDGLRTMLRESLGRLTGSDPERNALIRLETSFGGGKTHGLIALYHLAMANIPKKEHIKWLGDDIIMPKPNSVRVAGVVGSDLDPNIGLFHEKDEVRTTTMWGEITYQLAGKEGYEELKIAAESFSAPGTALFEEIERICGEKPTLIMIDELARYIRITSAVPTKTGKGNLADQTSAFLNSVVEYAASRLNVVVIITLAGEKDAFAEETEAIRQQLSESKAVSARQERVLHPSDEGEMPAIVVHRLFKNVDRKSAEKTIRRYCDYYSDLNMKNVEIPQRALRADFSKEFERSYPFHPDLLYTLDKKVSTIPNFQRTRGALRLLGFVVRSIWEEKTPGTYAIHPYHLDYAQPDITEEMTSRLDRPLFKQVIEADIISDLEASKAHAQEIDVDYPLPYAQRLASTIFIHSLSQYVATGLSLGELNLAVLTPDPDGGDDPGVVKRALDRLLDDAWYIPPDIDRYRFTTEVSPKKMISEEMSQVGPAKGKMEVDRRIRQIWKRGFLEPVYFPDSHTDVDDDAELPKLVIMHYDTITVEAGELSPPEIIRKIMGYKGKEESFRQYQNNLVFLVADKDQVEHMVDECRRYLASHRILGDPDRLNGLPKETIKKIKGLADTAELQARVAITRAYRYLFYPTADAPKSQNFLQCEPLPPQDTGELDRDQTNVVLRVLKSLKKVQTADDEILNAPFVRSKAWSQAQTHMSTEDLRKTFAQKVGLRMLLDVTQLKKTIANGVSSGTWIYYDAQEGLGYSKESPQPVYQISDTTYLYTLEEATKVGFPIKGVIPPPLENICPICGKLESECECGPGPEVKIPRKLISDGEPAKAFQKIADQCAEYKVGQINQLFITIDGLGQSAAGDLRALALAVPQLGRIEAGIDLHVVIEFGDMQDRELFDLRFQGSWDRYKRLRSVVEEFTKESVNPKIRARLEITFAEPLGVDGDEYGEIRQVLTSLEIGKITVEAEILVPEGEA